MKQILSLLILILAFAGFCGEKPFIRLVIASENVTENMKGEWILENPERKIFLKKNADTLIFTDFQVIELSKDSYGNDLATFFLYPDDAEKFVEFTKKNAGRKVACFIGKKFFCAPVILQEIQGGIFQIVGTFDDNDKKLLARMNNGKIRKKVQLPIND
ncbi:MAG: hypothetical protein IJW23_09935 [Lentisphaeria bacterium]|nr:hypothetical protein [Lentisphaeria bacterium]